MPIQDLNVEKHTNLLIRTVVKLLNVLLNRRLGSSPSCTHPGLISIAALGPIRSSPNMNLGSEDHNSNFFLFLFFFASTSKHCLSQKRTISQVLHLIAQSLVLRSFMALDGLLIIQIVDLFSA